jgi:hypothetical protein
MASVLRVQFMHCVRGTHNRLSVIMQHCLFEADTEVRVSCRIHGSVCRWQTSLGLTAQALFFSRGGGYSCSDMKYVLGAAAM